LPAVRAVIFDIGGVLFDWHPRYLFDKMSDDRALVDRLVGEAVTFAWHHQHDEGRDFADTSAELIAQFPEFERFIRAYGPRFSESIGAPIAGMHALVEELHDAGVPLFAITNFSHEFFPPFRNSQSALFDRFDDIVVSGVEKIAKPDSAIYALALTRFGLEPGESIFIDDVKANADAARANGMIGHHFQDAPSVRQELQRLGLPGLYT
jgi:2-haloacid dehalogenase